jgi:hypothetical protein
MVEKIRGIGTPVWYLMAKDEGHGFEEVQPRLPVHATIQFMRQYLLTPRRRLLRPRRDRVAGGTGP